MGLRMGGRWFIFCCPTRKKLTASLLALTGGFLFFSLFTAVEEYTSGLPREVQMERLIAELQNRLQYIESLYRSRQQLVLSLQSKILECKPNSYRHVGEATTRSLEPEVMALLKSLNGTRAATGVDRSSVPVITMPFMYQLLPHLLDDPDSLQPSFYMKSSRGFVDMVIGIPTVRRDKESYLLTTIDHLIKGMGDDELNKTLIIVYVGETDLEFVLNTAKTLEKSFPKHVRNGLIEVISPSPSYYPNWSTLKPTLGDSPKRFKWRTKQNLDTIYLMAFAQSKGTFYLMLEDDVIAKQKYMQEIKQYTASVTVSNPDWFFIEYCSTGGIGKLFKSSDLLRFVTYVQLFYTNMPIDWLLESYLANRICTIDKHSESCGTSKQQIRPKFKTSLFQHIGLYSSLKGKIQKVQKTQLNRVPKYFSHDNPAIRAIKTDVMEHSFYTLDKAYQGDTYFWGIKPRIGSVVEFEFALPTSLERFTFRSGNVEHINDKFYNTIVEVQSTSTGNYTYVGGFDEFGMAEGPIKNSLNPLSAIRLRVLKSSNYWVILSEIDLKIKEDKR